MITERENILTPSPKFQEEYSAKIPALALLSNLGWTFLSPDQALAARGGKINDVVLRDVLCGELKKRRYTFAGREYPLSEQAIDNLVAEVCSPKLAQGLALGNEAIYDHLIQGITVTEFIDGRKTSQTIPLIDWKNITNNSFLFTEEFTVLRTNGINNRRPDIVCFVNGIPLAVIEAKRPDGHLRKDPTIEEGISQQIRNQRNDEIPQLFAYSQLLIAIDGVDGKYGTQGTEKKFWSIWHEEGIAEATFFSLKNKKLSELQKTSLFAHRTKADRDWYENLIAGELAVTEQDRLLASLLSPERLFEMMRYFMLFDKKKGKIIARYPQFFAIKQLIDRVNTKRPDGGREGGVIWHTTGSGKSLTMVFLSRALILHPSLSRCRFIMVTDRVDLEAQLSKTFIATGLEKKEIDASKATSGGNLAKKIETGTERIIFSLVQKFNTATKSAECLNASSDIIVLIDEGHRSHGGENHIRMKLALPNAAFIAFTGTPLLKDDKTTNKFGPILHAYTMQRAVEDGSVTPLLYEERQPELDVNERVIDSWFARITEGLTDGQRTDLKKKLARKKLVYGSDDRIHLIALDIANHFKHNIFDTGLKAQLACDSKLSAIKYKQYLDEANLFESAIVISAPDTREGNTDVDESNSPEVARWWKQNVGSQDEVTYTKETIKRFEDDEDLKMLIVVDKLLTGFDEPKNAVLYIDKSLKGHNLLQAIARVNRLHDAKKFGLLIDYRGILAELDTTIAKYQDLAERSQGGFDIGDLQGLYQQMSTEYKRLPQLYKKLWDGFKDVANKSDFEQLRRVLMPRVEKLEGQMVDVNLKNREDFYEALTDFSSCLAVALQSADFFEDKSVTDADRQRYKEHERQFKSLRQRAQQDAGETIQYNTYADQVRKLADKHVVGLQIRESRGVYDVNKIGLKPETFSAEKLRNETDLIKTRLTIMIEQEMQDDPYAQAAFSALLKKIIEEAALLFDQPIKQYMLFRDFEPAVVARRLDEIPECLQGKRYAQAYFGIFKLVIPFAALAATEDRWAELAITLEDIVATSVLENSINSQNIEAGIRKNLLPVIFTVCKEAGAGINQAKEIVEKIVQSTLYGLNAACT